jgi:hypothetical protein
MKINVKAFALACGIMWGLGLFALTWWLSHGWWRADVAVSRRTRKIALAKRRQVTAY